MLTCLVKKNGECFRGSPNTARSTGNPGFFREFFIEKFITINAQGNFQPEGPGGGKGEPGGSPYPNTAAITCFQ